MKAPTQTPTGGKQWVVLSLPVVVLAAAATAYVYFNDDTSGEFARDADLCPTEGAVDASKAFLVDLTKPIDSESRSLPRELLRNVIGDLERNAELRVYLLTGSADAPRTELGRLCKPFANSDINLATKDFDGSAIRSCDELPAQITPEVRELATRFCALREDLESSLSRAVEYAVPETDGSYLVEALEDLRIEMAEWPAPQTLYVFSDMMQHAAWFSHLDLPWQQWSYADFARLREAQGWPAELANQGVTRVELFYVPRVGSTDQPRIHRSHRQFWREYFVDALVTFTDQAPMRSYGATALMGVPTAAELAASVRREAEDLLAQVRAEQEQLKVERERLLAQARHQEEQAEQARQQELLERRQAELAQQEREMQRVLDDGDGLAQAAAATRPPQLASDNPAAAAATQPREPLPTDRDVAPEPQNPLPEIAMASTTPPTESNASPAREAAPVDVPCEVTLSATADPAPAYPRGGRTNFGEASITIQYVVNEQGETVDDAVKLIVEESSAQRERYLGLFVESATDVVQEWTYDVAGTCAFPLQRSTTFEFSYGW